MITVDAASWRDVVTSTQADGYTFFEWLGCVDEIGRGGLRVLVALRNLATVAEPLLIGTELPLSDAPKAHRQVLESGAHGKIVLVP